MEQWSSATAAGGAEARGVRVRIACFDDGRLGVVATDNTVVDVSDLLAVYDPLGPEDLLPDLINNFDALKEELERRTSRGGGKPLAATKLNSPVTRPSKIVCLIGNYKEGTDRPPQIIDIFFKSPESINGHGGVVVLPPHEASIFHHEAEIAVIVGKDCKNLSEDEAMDAVFGYTGFNDVSARGTGRAGIASFLGKSFDTFGGFGPWITTADEIPDPQVLQITVDVNGERRQDYNTADMERPIKELMTYVSTICTLRAGDVICCGTNHQGLGSMQEGDACTVTVENIGSFTLHTIDPTRREWARGVDTAMAASVIAGATNPDPTYRKGDSA